MEQYDRREERTGVQEAHDYVPTIDIGCDFVMVYGLHNLRERIKKWKSRGYIVHLMTGVAWGNYQDYLYGKYDGIDHHDEGQVERGGREINHGKDVPYMVPSISFSRYLTQQLKYAIDCGIDAIHLKSPSFGRAPATLRRSSASGSFTTASHGRTRARRLRPNTARQSSSSTFTHGCLTGSARS